MTLFANPLGSCLYCGTAFFTEDLLRGHRASCFLALAEVENRKTFLLRPGLKLNIDPDWLRRMAEKEGNGIISVGGLVTRMESAAAWHEQRHLLQYLTIGNDRRDERDAIQAALDRIDSYEKSMDAMANAAISNWEDSCQFILKLADRLATASEVLGHLAEKKEMRRIGEPHGR